MEQSFDGALIRFHDTTLAAALLARLRINPVTGFNRLHDRWKAGAVASFALDLF
jgi:hypothetical protein